MTVSHHLGMILIALPALVISLYVSAQMWNAPTDSGGSAHISQVEVCFGRLWNFRRWMLTGRRGSLGWVLRFYCLCHLSCLIASGPPVQCEQPFHDPETIPSLPWRIRSLLQEWAKIKPLLPQIPPQDILVIVVRKVISTLCEYTNDSGKFLRKKNLCHNFANLIFYKVSQTKPIINIYF